MEAVSLDARTVIIKSDNENDIAEVIEFISKKQKKEGIHALLNFASQHRFIKADYIFNRDECYDE